MLVWSWVPALAIAAAPASRQAVSNPRELESFIDGLMAASLGLEHVAGAVVAVVAVVRDGTVLLTKGYGFSDLVHRTRVDPATTEFRIGSVSKLFIFTAVMQLVDEGKLDLDADVNSYLDFKIPPIYSSPITLRHLLTHTAGFEEDLRDVMVDPRSRIPSLREWVRAHLPARVRPPGMLAAYSNYGACLAGYIVERVSGVPWEAYFENRIFRPLGMARTTARQPLPRQFASAMSVGYRFEAGEFHPESWEILGTAPAGAVTTTAVDMTRFMIAHLENGRLGTARILSDSAARLMHARAFAQDPRLPGYALGFAEMSSHGIRIIGHGGDTRWFHADLFLIPADRTGVFVAFNTDSGEDLAFGRFRRLWLDHYYGTVTAQLDSTKRVSRDRFAGEYRLTRQSYTTWQRILALARTVTVEVPDDHSLIVHWPLGPLALIPVDSTLFRSPTGPELAAFRLDRTGRAIDLFLSPMPEVAFERVPWYATRKLHLGLLGVGLALYLGLVIAAIGRRCSGHGSPCPKLFRRARALLVGTAVAQLAFAASLAIIAQNFWSLVSGHLTGLIVALALPVIGGLSTAAAMVIGLVLWVRGGGTVGRRAWLTIEIVISLGFLWSESYWNLLGWRL